MVEAYPLDELLDVRHFREESAKRSVAAAESAHREAQAEAERIREELARWRVWKEEEIERRYAALLGTALTVEELRNFNRGIARFSEEELERTVRVEDADRALEEALRRMKDARKSVRTARQNAAKIEVHKERWREAMKIEIEREEEREFEDFKPVGRLGAEAPEG